MRSTNCLVLFTCGIATCLAGALSAQQVYPVRKFSTEGVIKALGKGAIAITDKTEKSWKMTMPREGRVKLASGIMFAAANPKLTISGELSIEAAEPGFPVRIRTKTNRDGKLAEPVAEVAWVDDAQAGNGGVKTARKSKSSDDFVDTIIVGAVDNVSSERLTLRVPRSRFARKGKMVVPITKDAKLIVESTDLSKVQPGDEANVSGVEFNTGDFVVQTLEVRVVDLVDEDRKGKKNKKKSSVSRSSRDTKYDKYSDKPAPPRPIRGKHYILHTDMSERDAHKLLDKLEKMLGLISRYFGRPQLGIVECYVVQDLKAWPPNTFPPDVLTKIENKEGTTRSLHKTSQAGRQSKAIVYAQASEGVVQHESVHAYCQQTFGSSGPVWYAEGMAELGRYWEENRLEVDVEPAVLRFLQKAKEPKRLKEILAPGQITGDSWQAYAWRWALCHLMANNPNYNKRFKGLGIALMSQQSSASFESVYGSQARELAFEYDQFVKNVGNGYRADLCAWRWNKRFVTVDRKGHQRVKVMAKAGWQPGSVRVEQGKAYEVAAKGKWKITGTGETATADGNDKEEGKLVAAVMTEAYELSDEIPLGTRAKFTAPASGNLYLRCGEQWTRLADNSDSITAYIRMAK